jgi:hypothetical protein
LTIVVVYADKFELQVNVTGHCPSCVTGEQIDFARCQSGETRFAGCWNEFNSHVVAQYSRRNRATYSNIKTLPNAIRVRLSETWNTCGHTTVQFATCFNIIEGASRYQASRKASYSQCTKKYGFFHFYLILFSTPKGQSNPINLIGMNARVSSAMEQTMTNFMSAGQEITAKIGAFW